MHSPPVLRLLFFGVVCSADFGSAAPPRELPPAPELRLSVALIFTTELEAATLELALDEVERIFEAGNVRFDWRCPSCPSRVVESSTPRLEILFQTKPPNKVITGCRRNRHDHRLGHTLLRRRRITLWTSQVQRAVSGDWDRSDLAPVDGRTYGRALGRVLSHELGHLLLRLAGHREEGLMRSSFSHRSLTSHRGRSFRLHPQDLERIRAAIRNLGWPFPG